MFNKKERVHKKGMDPTQNSAVLTPAAPSCKLTPDYRLQAAHLNATRWNNTSRIEEQTHACSSSIDAASCVNSSERRYICVGSFSAWSRGYVRKSYKRVNK